MLHSYYFDQPVGGTWSMRLRWAGAGLLVTLAHAAVVWLAVSWKSAPAEAAEPAQGMVIELAALAIEPDLAEQTPPPSDEAKVEPQMEPIEEATTPPEPVEPPAVEPEQAVEAPVPPTPTPSDVVMAPPTPKVEVKPQEKPREIKPPKITPKPVREVKPKEHKREVKQARLEPQRHERTTPSSAAASARAAATSQAAAPVAAPAPASGAALASWRGSLIAHLNRHKRFPAGAHSAGAASVAFTIDRSGRVLSSSLVRSSGDAALDGEAVAMMRRASPVPQPPAGVGGNTISLAVPVRFNR